MQGLCIGSVFTISATNGIDAARRLNLLGFCFSTEQVGGAGLGGALVPWWEAGDRWYIGRGAAWRGSTPWLLGSWPARRLCPLPAAG